MKMLHMLSALVIVSSPLGAQSVDADRPNGKLVTLATARFETRPTEVCGPYFAFVPIPRENPTGRLLTFFVGDYDKEGNPHTRAATIVSPGLVEVRIVNGTSIPWVERVEREDHPTGVVLITLSSKDFANAPCLANISRGKSLPLSRT